MITGQIKNEIDRIWDVFWTGGIRTPRHIIAMMVELMRPSLDDTICDPAMGSAGFIVESAKYVKKPLPRRLRR